MLDTTETLTKLGLIVRIAGVTTTPDPSSVPVPALGTKENMLNHWHQSEVLNFSFCF